MPKERGADRSSPRVLDEASATATRRATKTTTDHGARPARYYRTRLGTAWLGDATDVLTRIETGSVQAIITSPPFALRRKKRYGNRPENEYIPWFMSFVNEFKRVLADDGSLVIELGGAWMNGVPVRSIYHFELLVDLVRKGGFHLAEEFYWYNKAKIPSPAQWVTVDRVRVKDAVNVIWWLSKTEKPKANNRNVLRPYSESMRKLFVRGYNRGPRPSGWSVRHQFARNNGGAIPPNLIEVGNNASRGTYYEFCNKYGHTLHPARFPREVPEFFIKFLTDPNDLILDPFGGSNMTGAVAEELGRRWVVSELRSEYLDGSLGRFDPKPSELRLLAGANPNTPVPSLPEKAEVSRRTPAKTDGTPRDEAVRTKNGAAHARRPRALDFGDAVARGLKLGLRSRSSLPSFRGKRADHL
jgi:DNA modification methylase